MLSLLPPPASGWEERIVIHPVGERQWEDINWNGLVHHMCVNTKLGSFCRLLYPSMVHIGGRRVATCSWTHWALRQYIDQGSF
jgi:hypothetical protein